MPRFFLTERGVIVGKEAHHLIKVHRHAVGDIIEVVSLGRVFRAVITGHRSDEVSVELMQQLPCPEASISVTLMQGIPKGDKFEFIIQKAVELGVMLVVPVACSRSVAVIAHAKAAARVARWQAIATEAAKQSGRATVPKISEPLDLSLAAAQATASLKLVAYEGEGQGLKQVLRRAEASQKTESVACLVGPEGGLSTDEVKAAVACGFIPVTLGPRILRTETAALALVSAVMYELADLGGSE